MGSPESTFGSSISWRTCSHGAGARILPTEGGRNRLKEIIGFRLIFTYRGLKLKVHRWLFVVEFFWNVKIGSEIKNTKLLNRLLNLSQNGDTSHPRHVNSQNGPTFSRKADKCRCCSHQELCSWRQGNRRLRQQDIRRRIRRKKKKKQIQILLQINFFQSFLKYQTTTKTIWIQGIPSEWWIQDVITWAVNGLFDASWRISKSWDLSAADASALPTRIWAILAHRQRLWSSWNRRVQHEPYFFGTFSP